MQSSRTQLPAGSALMFPQWVQLRSWHLDATGLLVCGACSWLSLASDIEKLLMKRYRIHKSSGWKNNYLVEEVESSCWRRWIIWLKHNQDSQILWLEHIKMFEICWWFPRRVCWVSFENMRARELREPGTNQRLWCPIAIFGHLEIPEIMKIDVLRRLENGIHHPRMQNR